MSCDRTAAVYGLGDDGSGHGGHHNYQLPLFGLSLILIGGGATQHFFSALPFPYTALLLLVGMLLGVWVHFDPAFTLQPGTDEFTYSYKDAELQCNISTWVPNDLNYHGWHLGNSLRQISGMDPHLLLHLLLPPLLFESAFAIDWHIFYKVHLSSPHAHHTHSPNALTIFTPSRASRSRHTHSSWRCLASSSPPASLPACTPACTAGHGRRAY